MVPPDMFRGFLALEAVLVTLGVFVLDYLIRRRVRRHSILHLPGPDSKSWLVGHVPSFQRVENAGDPDFQWSDKYGLAFRTKGCFGEDLLYLADPKALHHVLNRMNYKYPKPHEARHRQQMSSGRGIAWAHGTQHVKQRKIMSPAFSSTALKGFLPVFFEIAHKMIERWKTIVPEQDKASSVIDVSSWLTRTTLDIIGEAAFDYNFNAVEGGGTELHAAYHNLFTNLHYMLSDSTIMFRRLIGYIPMRMSQHLVLMPKKERTRKCKDLVHEIGKELLAREKEAFEAGKEGGKDLMSILFKANSTEDPNRRLNEEEVLSQMMTFITRIIQAGHETTANTLSWILFELSRHPDVQDRLRAEIKAVRDIVDTRGDTQLSISDLESMKYTVSVIKETMRFYPIVLQLARKADCDDIIPLEWPQRTVSGELVSEIPVSKGQVVTLSICVYNRLKRIWGNDANEWRPERFLDPLPSETKVKLGVFGNLATFSSGVHNCIGWRFSLLEMQAILVELIENFEFSLPPGDVEVVRGFAALVQPLVRGEESKGKQMPLTVTPVRELP